jgi:hypothetical protein
MSTDFNCGLWVVFSNVGWLSVLDVDDSFVRTEEVRQTGFLSCTPQLVPFSYDPMQCSTVTCKITFTTHGAIAQTL